MARVIFSLPDHDISIDITNDPLVILLTAENEEGEVQVIESQVQSNMAVTQPKKHDY